MLSDNQERAVRDCAFSLLQRNGFRITDDECLRAPQGFGCEVDAGHNLVRLAD